VRRALAVKRIGPAVTVQDMGRPGFLALGLSQGGAADRHAMIEGATLLGQSPDCAALEMAGYGGDFIALSNLRIALTGAPMMARIDGTAAVWNASHALHAGQVLSIGAVVSGTYGYLHVGGGVDTHQVMQSRSVHLAAGLGKPVAAGDDLPIGSDATPGHVGMILTIPDRNAGGVVRILTGAHTSLFSAATLHRFTQTEFTKTLRANRQGAQLMMQGASFEIARQLGILSEPMIPGDVQMTGDGQPFVLLAECQTTGGYPRIGTVMPDDLSAVAQADPRAVLRFRFVSHADALAQHVPLSVYAAGLRAKIRPLIRQPWQIADLMDYQLISGAVTGWDDV
jgi:5-oxoprolinase (ATP-hydrolysing) subunit C